jgi:NAD(P)H-flavin reductase
VPCSEFRVSQRLEMRTREDALREGKLMTTAAPVTLSKLVSRHEVAERTTAFRFEKPSNWTFKAGQFLEMTLLDPSVWPTTVLLRRAP